MSPRISTTIRTSHGLHETRAGSDGEEPTMRVVGSRFRRPPAKREPSPYQANKAERGRNRSTLVSCSATTMAEAETTGRSPTAGDRIWQARHDRPGSRPTARPTPSSAPWSSGVGSLTSPPATSARPPRLRRGLAPEPSVAGHQWNPRRTVETSSTSSRRSPRALRRLRRRNPPTRSPRGLSPSPLEMAAPLTGSTDSRQVR